MKKKIRADSVDELFEIVKAIQNGEEPEAYSKRKAEEQKAQERRKAEEQRAREQRKAEEQRARKQRRAEERQSEERKSEERRTEAQREASEYRARESESEEDEAFERLLDEESDEGFGEAGAIFGEAAERLKEAGGFLKVRFSDVRNKAQESIGEFMRSRTEREERQEKEQEKAVPRVRTRREEQQEKEQEKAASRVRTKREERQEEEQEKAAPRTYAREESEMEEIHSMGRVRLADIEKMPEGKTRRRYGAKTVSEEAENVGWRILRSLHMESESSDEKKAEPLKKDETAAEDETAAKEETAAKAETAVDAETAAKEDSAAKDEATAKAETAVQDEPVTEDNVSKNEIPGGDNPVSAEVPAENGDGRTGVQKVSGRIRDFAIQARQALSGFAENGFGKRQAAVAGAVLIIVILLVSLGISAIRQTIQLREKQKYVTADAGLTITVENQPDSWCNTWDLELKFSVKRGTISTITIDGTVYVPDESGIVTVTAVNEQLQASVETEDGDGTLTASIEIPMLDEEAPELTVEKSDGTIVLSAEDSRSSVQAIWYAAVEEDDWVQLPQYQTYSEPIVWEEGKTYYFYASDQAGNCSTPVVTTMEDAQSLAFEETGLSLLPGETASVQAQVNPAGAFLENITYDSSDTDVVTVSSDGLVTAVADGTAIVSASAEGVDVAACSVTVASEQTVTISAIGDCTLGTYSGMLSSVSFDTYYALYGATYFFQNVRDVLANDDATFANLEGPLTDAATAVEKEYAFKGDPAYTEILQDASIEVVTLANNHSGDYGSEGLEDTKENLTEAGIDYCAGDTIAYQQISGVKVAFIGIYELSTGLECESQVRETIAEAQSEGAKLIIVAFHWGSEKENTPDETQQSLAHTAIDCGADLVVGHHPHVLQGIEKYNGKYIVYSLGNFCFGGNSNPSDKDTMIFRQTFTITQDGTADDDAIEIIPCTLSSASDSNDYRPTVATGTDADEIMERINEYSAEFGDITYTASTGL